MPRFKLTLEYDGAPGARSRKVEAAAGEGRHLNNARLRARRIRSRANKKKAAHAAL
jgi:hypothetical protein